MVNWTTVSDESKSVKPNFIKNEKESKQLQMKQATSAQLENFIAPSIAIQNYTRIITQHKYL